MKIINKLVADLIPYVNNARTHSDQQIAQIASSIKEFGFCNPVLIDGQNGIIAGHGRVLAAQKLGLKEVPTIELSHLTDTQRKAYILADNRLAELSGWDDELLKLELTGLELLEFDLELIGFDDLKFSEDKKEIENIEDVPEDLGGAIQLKQDMKFPSKLPWGIPEIREDLLADIPDNIRCWAGKDATPDDGDSYYLWNWRTDSLKECPLDRLMIGFYTDDYRFEPVWNEPHIYVAKMLNMGISIALSPNFSLWSDQAEALQLLSTYKSRWVARYMQEAGIAIIPDINWSTESSFKFCLLGIPKNAPACSVQLQTLKTDKEISMAKYGLQRALDELTPQSLIVYGGKLANELISSVKYDGEVVYIASRTALRSAIMKQSRG